MTENRQPAPVGALETDGGRKMKSFWKWAALHFVSRREGTYDLAKAEEKYGTEAETQWRDSDDPAPEDLLKKKSFWKWAAHHFPCSGAGRYNLAEAEEKYWKEVGTQWRDSDDPAPEDLLAAEEQQEHRVVDKSHICRQYKIGCKLGEGGFGLVYEGTRHKDGLQVAIKFSNKMPTMTSIRVPGHPRGLPMEIGLMLMANNGPSVSQIIKLLDWEDDTDHYVIIMERPVPCVDLFSFVKLCGGNLDEGKARCIMWQVIEAAKTCCDRGVFHRDIKLQNLLVNQDTMEVKLIDFGCGAVMKKSAFKSFSGTKPYCPPEFEAKGRYHAKPTTVWTLGILLFIIVCGHFPTYLDLSLISENNWIRPILSHECCQMICDCLQPDPQKRLSLDKMHHHDWFEFTE